MKRFLKPGAASMCLAASFIFLFAGCPSNPRITGCNTFRVGGTTITVCDSFSIGPCPSSSRVTGSAGTFQVTCRSCCIASVTRLDEKQAEALDSEVVSVFEYEEEDGSLTLVEYLNQDAPSFGE